MTTKPVSLQDFLKDVKDNYQDVYEKASKGAPSGAFDGPPLPENLEYRVTVDSAEYKPSKAGNYQIVLTFVISEPEEFAGRKVQEYYSPQPGNEVAQRKLTSMLGSLGPDLSGLGQDWNELAKRLVGLPGVITSRTWGEQNDRSGVRWVNADKGQVLRNNIAPPKPQGSTRNALRPDVSISRTAPAEPVQEAPAEAQAPVEYAEAPVQTPAQVLPQATRPAGGPNLPPGLR